MKSTDIFNAATFEIFYLCLEEFPSEVRLDPNIIARKVEGYFGDPTGDLEAYNHVVSIAEKSGDTINWLAHEGYIRLEHEYLSEPSTYVLTPKGLQAANVKIDSLENKPTFIEIIKGGIKHITLASMPLVISAMLK
ncbi:hypothetical protein [Shewanella sp. KCT]|uniref:hypothetical protein n=1 Tax=Shewanella sp. KCT TaxID=2569535 RepID=UPI0011829D8A|nr:hypothetical protein [Shewanella sp. KCT]TVP08755.1 hypothetical protein AYI87_20830 [Shewanella sp. KCT]